jgi:hypothetical protein
MNYEMDIEVDAKGRVYLAFNGLLAFWDENGGHKASLQVVPLENAFFEGIYDIACNRDGKVYVYYRSEVGTELAEVDYENTSLINAQLVMMGEKIAFGPEDGFFISNGTELYSYNTDAPTVERDAKQEFVWWDYLINGGNLSELEVLEDGRMVAVISSSKLELCHTLIIAQRTVKEAEEAAQKDERVKLKRE